MFSSKRYICDEIFGILFYNLGFMLDEVWVCYQFVMIVKFGLNENLFGFLFSVMDFGNNFFELVRFYFDFKGCVLCDVLVVCFGVDVVNIVLGNGLEDLIGVICCVVVCFGDVVIMFYFFFLLYEDYVVLMGGLIECIGLKLDFMVDMDVLIVVVK